MMSGQGLLLDQLKLHSRMLAQATPASAGRQTLLREPLKPNESDRRVTVNPEDRRSFVISLTRSGRPAAGQRIAARVSAVGGARGGAVGISFGLARHRREPLSRSGAGARR